MTKRFQSNAVARFRNACSQGPTPAPPAPEVGFDTGTSDWRERKSEGLFSVGERKRQKNHQGEVETDLFKSGADTHRETQKHRDQTMAASDRRAIDIGAIVIDEGVERRGQQRLRSSEAWSAIQTSDAMSVVTQYCDAKIAAADSISDQELRDKFVSEHRLMHAQALTRIRLMAYDLRYDPDGLPGGELG